MSDDHYLDSYLTEILPALGLDAETYAPYVTGYANNNSDDDGESLDELIELLRESSEIDGEDDAWENFRKEISLRRQDYLAEVDLRKELSVLEIQAATHANLQKEIELSQKNALEIDARKQVQLVNDKPENMSAEKIALIRKFGYEDSDDDAQRGHDDGDTEAPNTNHDQAAALLLQKAQKLKSAPKQTKNDARQETKKMKADKNAKKEARRKKAEKRERQR
ncbi:hypothetical protein ACHAXA_004527 [Cyclostephanos tholiformis]|uniref:Coiled-coil domain-containing protein 43 n=1 Tax=Cyclostephanos tholiformis TaxID=382380 RepID=A0ABD3RV64_9STRA